MIHFREIHVVVRSGWNSFRVLSKIGFCVRSIKLSDFSYRYLITFCLIFRMLSEDKDIPLRKAGIVCDLLVQLCLLRDWK
jgi:hypothetical protein